MSRRTVSWVAILALSAVVLLIVVGRHPSERVYQGMPQSNRLPMLDKLSDTSASAAVTGQSLSQSPPAEQANITYNFQGIPLQQFLDEYESLAGKKVTMTTPEQGKILQVKTVRPLTRSEALKLCEEVLQEQAGLVIVHGKDGSLTAVAKPKKE
jgi:type II secretory pathway component GspD/PulD (secretin)